MSFGEHTGQKLATKDILNNKKKNISEEKSS